MTNVLMQNGNYSFNVQYLVQKVQNKTEVAPRAFHCGLAKLTIFK